MYRIYLKLSDQPRYETTKADTFQFYNIRFKFKTTMCVLWLTYNLYNV